MVGSVTVPDMLAVPICAATTATVRRAVTNALVQDRYILPSLEAPTPPSNLAALNYAWKFLACRSLYLTLIDLLYKPIGRREPDK